MIAKPAKGNVKEKDNSYPHAPLGEVWVDGNLKTFIDKLKMKKEEGEMNGYLSDIERITLASKNPVHLNEGKSLLGRRWVWDEGHYTDCGKNNNAKRGSVESTSTRGSLDGPRRSERYGSSVRLSNVSLERRVSNLFLMYQHLSRSMN